MVCSINYIKIMHQNIAMKLTIVLLGLLLAGTRGHEPRFYAGDCGEITCTVPVEEPHMSQVF